MVTQHYRGVFDCNVSISHIILRLFKHTVYVNWSFSQWCCGNWGLKKTNWEHSVSAVVFLMRENTVSYMMSDPLLFPPCQRVHLSQSCMQHCMQRRFGYNVTKERYYKESIALSMICLPEPIEAQQQLEPYLAIRLSSAKPAPRTDNPSFASGLTVTQGAQAPVKRQESPHLPFLFYF